MIGWEREREDEVTHIRKREGDVQFFSKDRGEDVFREEGRISLWRGVRHFFRRIMTIKEETYTSSVNRMKSNQGW